MPMKVMCPKCGKELKAPPELQGKRVACPRCNEGFRVASPTDAPPGAAVPVRVLPPPVNRRAQAAKFIADEATETRVQLGADGRLPALLFQSRAAEQDPQEPQTRESNPLLLIGVLCFSITLSLILLIFDPQGGGPTGEAKDMARQAILRGYVQDPDVPDRVRERLREALGAFHREDYTSERRLYREVLNMLKNESIRDPSNPKGLTGPREARSPPNDRHLEQQLATLLSVE